MSMVTATNDQADPTDLTDLTDEDVAALQLVANSDTAVALRLGKASTSEKLAAKRVDGIIKKSQVLTSPITLYKSFANNIDGTDLNPILRSDTTITEKAFLTGSTSKPTASKDAITLAIKIPAGTHVVQVLDNGYILARGLKIKLSKQETGDVPASLVASALVPHIMIYTMPPQEIYEQASEANCEFYNHNHGVGGRFAPGGDGGGGGQRGGPQGQGKPRNQGGQQGQGKPRNQGGYRGQDNRNYGNRSGGGGRDGNRPRSQQDYEKHIRHVRNLQTVLLTVSAAIGLVTTVLTIAEKLDNRADRKAYGPKGYRVPGSGGGVTKSGRMIPPTDPKARKKFLNDLIKNANDPRDAETEPDYPAGQSPQAPSHGPHTPPSYFPKDYGTRRPD